MTPTPIDAMVGQVAQRIEQWSRQEEELVARLVDLQAESATHAPDDRGTLPAQWDQEPPPLGPQSLAQDLSDPPVDPWEPMVRQPTDLPLNREGGISMEAGQEPAQPSGRLGPFDELFEVVSAPRRASIREDGPLPPRNRFMVRVAQVPKPGRTTKRNYDYFEELNAMLAERAKSSEGDAEVEHDLVDDRWLPVRDSH